MLLGNAGVPMICVALPFMALALIPVAIVETAIYRWRLAIAWQRAWWGSLRANAWSIFAGVPVAWGAQLVVQLLVSGSASRDPSLLRLAWLPLPYEQQLMWMYPAAVLCLLVPCWVISIAVERFCFRLYWPEVEPHQLTLAVVFANAASYLFLASLCSLRLVASLQPRIEHAG